MTESVTVFGREQTRNQIHAGLALLIGGFLLGLAAMGLFLFAGSREGMAIYRWREGALVLGAVALTTFFVGISTALPAAKPMRIAGYVGVALCLVAVVLFAVHYPLHFNVQDSQDPNQADYTSLDTSLFAIGLAIVIAGAAVSVVGYYVEKVKTWAVTGSWTSDHNDPNYEVPDWVVERDIEDAMKRYGAAWGLDEDATARLKLKVNDSFDGAIVKGRGKARVVRLTAKDHDQAVATLQQMKPGYRGRKQADQVDAQVAALRAFRAQVAADPKSYKPGKVPKKAVVDIADKADKPKRRRKEVA